MLNLAPLVCPISIRLGSVGKGRFRMESAQRRLGHGQSPSERRQENPGGRTRARRGWTARTCCSGVVHLSPCPEC